MSLGGIETIDISLKGLQSPSFHQKDKKIPFAKGVFKALPFHNRGLSKKIVNLLANFQKQFPKRFLKRTDL